MYDIIKEKIDKFEEKMTSDERITEFLKGGSRKVLLEIPDDESYHFTANQEGIKDFGKGMIDDPDITITANIDIIKGIFNGEIKPLKAYIKKQIKFKASIQDMLFIRKLM